MKSGIFLPGRRALGLGVCCLALVTASHGQTTRCEVLRDGVEYRAFLPGQSRYIYADVKAQPGAFPAIFIIIDKNYLSASPGSDAANTKWWLDRTRPLLFSGDSVKVSWKKTGTWTAITSIVSDRDTVSVEQPIPGLSKTPAGFSGTGTHDSNSFAFQIRLGITDLDVDAFDVFVPSISFEGVTLSLPAVHFIKDDTSVTAKC